METVDPDFLRRRESTIARLKSDPTIRWTGYIDSHGGFVLWDDLPADKQEKWRQYCLRRGEHSGSGCCPGDCCPARYNGDDRTCDCGYTWALKKTPVSRHVLPCAE